MPWLDLLAEDKGEAGRPGRVGLDSGDHVVLQGAEDLGGEGTAVVEVELERVSCMRNG